MDNQQSFNQNNSSNIWKILAGLLIVIIIAIIIWFATSGGSNNENSQALDQNDSGLDQLSDLTSSQTGDSEQTPNPSPNPNPTETPIPTPNPNPNPNPTPAPSGEQSNSFLGTWNGSFTPNAISAAAGCTNGALTFTVAQSGSFTGFITVDGTRAAGGGTVSSSGKVSGAWTYSGTEVNLNGQLSGNSGSGSYIVESSCTGSFSVTKA